MGNLFNSLGNNQYPNPKQADPMQMVNELKNNPANFLKNYGFNIPNGVNTNNPESIINGLMQSGQIGNNRFQRALQTAMRMFGR